MIYTTKDEMWRDETGMLIPRTRLTNYEKLREKTLAKLLKEAKVITAKLDAFKKQVQAEEKALFEAAMADNAVKVDSKGNWNVFSFDRSIRFEVAISEPIKFDDLTIMAAQTLLNEFLQDEIESKNEFVKDLIRDAFATSRGKLDSKRVLGLVKHKMKINNAKFSQACDLIEKGVVRPKSKKYHRIFLKDSEGEYKCVELNFSNI
jgi:Protein of unknown function (DUF3164).